MWNHEDGWQDPEGQEAKISMEMKWSLWSADRSLLKQEAPALLQHLDVMYNSRLDVTLSSRKEIRWGRLSITGTSEVEGSTGELNVEGTISEGWDSVEDLLATLDLGEEFYDDLAERLPRTDDGEVGVSVTVDHAHLPTVEALLWAIDADEDQLIRDSAEAWSKIEIWAKARR